MFASCSFKDDRVDFVILDLHFLINLVDAHGSADTVLSSDFICSASFHS